MFIWALLFFGLPGRIAASFNNLNIRRYFILIFGGGIIFWLSPFTFTLTLLLSMFHFAAYGLCGKSRFLRTVVIAIDLLLLFAIHYMGQSGISKICPFLLPYTHLEIYGSSFLIIFFIDHLLRSSPHRESHLLSFVNFAASAFYLPRFFSGPIVNTIDLQDQISSNSETKHELASSSDRLLLGFFKQIVIADSIYPMVHSVLDYSHPYPFLTVYTACALYSLQLYFAFSGYTDIALGVSGLIGISLPENFNRPFSQKNWSAFWNSWHSSLTQWLWQFVFTPVYLTMSRWGLKLLLAETCSVITVFLAMAFFNGIQVGYFISAGIFALFYLLEKVFRWHFCNKWLIFIVFSFGLFFFRQPGLEKAIWFLQQAVEFKNYLPSQWPAEFFAPLANGGHQQDYFNFGFSLLITFSFLFAENKISLLLKGEKSRVAVWMVLLFLVIIWGVFGNGENFAYVQF